MELFGEQSLPQQDLYMQPDPINPKNQTKPGFQNMMRMYVHTAVEH